MTRKTGADRVREHRARKRSAGLKEVRVFAHPGDADKIKAYARGLRDSRGIE